MALRLLWRRPQSEAAVLLRNACERASRPIDIREFDDALLNAARIVESSKTGSHNGALYKPKPKWDKVNYEKAHRVVMAWPDADQSVIQSPVSLDPTVRHTENVIDAIYPGNPWLSVAHRGSWDFQTVRREDLRGLFHLACLMVPSPMTGPLGRTQEGKWSEHTLEATGPRTVLVIEFDFRKIDELGVPTPWAPYIQKWEDAGLTISDACLALHAHLATTAPLAVLTFSGGKSTHGTYAAKGVPLDKLHTWMNYVVKLGGDPATWTRSQFVRVPDGTRYPGSRRQQLLYFNPKVL
jgi:hypothetical protein